MRIILKIIAAPFVFVLTIAGAILSFIFSFASWALNILSGIGVLLGVVLLLTGQPTNGIIIIAIAFLISPLGLPKIIGWIINKLDDINYSLKNFITS